MRWKCLCAIDVVERKPVRANAEYWSAKSPLPTVYERWANEKTQAPAEHAVSMRPASSGKLQN